jgi:hypothetical protein
MNDLHAVGPLPDFTPDDQACHVRLFTEGDLIARFGGFPEFRLVKIPGRWRPGRYPVRLVPVEFGAFFVSFAKP